jgi:hypothetical protein
MAFAYCLRVSSRFRTSGTSDNFEVPIEPPINTSHDCTAFVSQVSIPVTWLTFTQDVNDQLVLAYNVGAWNTLLLNFPQGYYDADTFCQTLQDMLNSIGLTSDPWSVQLQSDGRISISWGSSTAQFCFLPVSQVGVFQNLPVPAGFNPTKSANYTIGLVEATASVYGSGVSQVFQGLFNSLHTTAIYLHSNLSTFSSQGPAPGDRDVICRVPVDVPYGYFCHFQDSGNEKILFPVGGQSISKLQFRLTDSAGVRLNLQNADIDIEIWFYDQP